MNSLFQYAFSFITLLSNSDLNNNLEVLTDNPHMRSPVVPPLKSGSSNYGIESFSRPTKPGTRFMTFLQQSSQSDAFSS